MFEEVAIMIELHEQRKLSADKEMSSVVDAAILPAELPKVTASQLELRD